MPAAAALLVSAAQRHEGVSLRPLITWQPGAAELGLQLLSGEAGAQQDVRTYAIKCLFSEPPERVRCRPLRSCMPCDQWLRPLGVGWGPRAGLFDTPVPGDRTVVYVWHMCVLRAAHDHPPLNCTPCRWCSSCPSWCSCCVVMMAPLAPSS